MRDASANRIAVDQCELSHYFHEIDFAQYDGALFIDDFIGYVFEPPTNRTFLRGGTFV